MDHHRLTPRLLSVFLLLTTLLSCTKIERDTITIKGDLTNLPPGQLVLMALESGSWVSVDSVSTRDGVFEFNLPAAQYPEPVLMTINHYDSDSVKRPIVFATGVKEKAGFGGREASNDFYLEDGVEIVGPVKVRDRGWYKGIFTAQPIRAGRQSRVMYHDTVGFRAVTSVNELVGLVKQHPYSYYYLQNIKARAPHLSPPQFYKLFNAFDQEVRESKTGREIKNYVDTRSQKTRP